MLLEDILLFLAHIRLPVVLSLKHSLFIQQAISMETQKVMVQFLFLDVLYALLFVCGMIVQSIFHFLPLQEDLTW